MYLNEYIIHLLMESKMNFKVFPMDTNIEIWSFKKIHLRILKMKAICFKITQMHV